MKQLFQVKVLTQFILFFTLLSIIGLVIRNDFQSVRQHVLSQELILTNILKSTEANSLQLLDAFSLNLLQTNFENKVAINSFAENAMKQYPFIYMFGLVQTISKEKLIEDSHLNKQPFKLKTFSYDNGREWLYLEPKPLNFPVTYVYPQSSDTLDIIGLDISLTPFLSEILKPISQSSNNTNEETSLFNKRLVDPFELAEGGFGLSINKTIGKYYYKEKIYPKMIPSIVLKTKMLFTWFSSNLSDVSLEVGFPKKEGSYWVENSIDIRNGWSVDQHAQKQFLGMELAIKLSHKLSVYDFNWLLILALVFFMIVVYFTVNSLFFKLSSSQRQLSIVNEELNITIESKNEMFSNISHELKTPLTLILLPLQKILESESLNKRDRSRIELIERNSQRLKGLVEKVMDLTFVQSHQEPIQVVDINEQINKQILAFRSSFNDKSIDFNYKLQSSIQVQATMTEVHTIIENLLSNALKYTDKNGWVALRTSIKNGQFILETQNSHTGLTEVECKKVFQRFERLKQEENKDGHGLGLSLLRSICKNYHWKIECQSTLNHSVLFSIVISEFEENHPSQQISEINNQSSVGRDHQVEKNKELLPRLLIVEDNQDLRLFLKELFEVNYAVTVANNMVAEMTGFSSQSYFSKAFKKQFSISPSQINK